MAGTLPFIMAALLVMSALVIPSVFRSVFNLFVPPGVDAPDNWAVGFTRILWLFIVSSGIGFTLTCTGLWLYRRPAQPS